MLEKHFRNTKKNRYNSSFQKVQQQGFYIRMNYLENWIYPGCWDHILNPKLGDIYLTQLLKLRSRIPQLSLE